MKLTERKYEVIEMTHDEENALYDTPWTERFVCGKKVLIWNTSDGHNFMQLEGEDFCRDVVHVE